MVFLFGAGGGTRTHTVSLPTDFESVTSTNSITPALTLFIISDERPKFKRNLCFRRKRKSQAFIAHKFSPFILSNFNMTIWPPSIPLVGSLRFSLLCSSCSLQFPPFSHASHTAYADSPISRKQARKATSLLIYPSIFRG